MKNVKLFEDWNDNIIDTKLFASGRAKHSANVNSGKVTYKTNQYEPFYTAEISKKGDKFICKIYKTKKDGEEIRLRNKVKDNLLSSHNYVREFLNQKMKKTKTGDDKKKRKKRKKKLDFKKVEKPGMDDLFKMPGLENRPRRNKKKKSIIRRFE